MTGLDLDRDALVEIAARGHRLRPQRARRGRRRRHPAARTQRWSTMDDVVVDMHTDVRAARPSCRAASRSRTPRPQVLAYVREHVPEPRKAPAGRQLGRHRPRLPRPGHARARRPPALPDRRRLVDQGAVAALVPAGLLRRPGQARRPPGPRRHPREHRRSCATTARPCSSRARPGQPTAREIAARFGTPPPDEPPDAGRRGPAAAPDVGPGRRPILVHCFGRRTSAARMVGVAQLVEHLVVVQGVAGSSPVTHPKRTCHRLRRGSQAGIDRR